MNRMFEKHLAALIAPRGVVIKLAAMIALAVCSVVLPEAASSQENKPEDTRKLEETRKLEDARKLAETRKPTAEELEVWRKAIVHTRREKKDVCYRASYPDTAWHEVPCKAIPHKPNYPKMVKGIRPDQVGGSSGADFSATTTNGITEADGRFDSVTTSGSSNPTSLSCNSTQLHLLHRRVLVRPPPESRACLGVRDGSNTYTARTMVVKSRSSTGSSSGVLLAPPAKRL